MTPASPTDTPSEVESPPTLEADTGWDAVVFRSQDPPASETRDSDD